MSAEAKRNRFQNFDTDEKLFLLSIIKKYEKVLESKVTNATTWKEKEETWKKVEDEFNASNPRGIERNVNNLRNFYNNSKKETRKVVAEEKKSFKKTGGGPGSNVSLNPIYDLTLSIMNKKTVFGLNNKFDDDALITGPSSSKANVSNHETDENESVDYDQNKESANDHPEDPNKNLSGQINSNRSEQQTIRTSWQAKRRPALTATGNVAKKYENLAEVKLEVAKIRLSMLKSEEQHQKRRLVWESEEHEFKKSKVVEEWKMKKNNEELTEKRKSEEHDLRIRNLQLDLILKEAQIQALNAQ